MKALVQDFNLYQFSPLSSSITWPVTNILRRCEELLVKCLLGQSDAQQPVITDDDDDDDDDE